MAEPLSLELAGESVELHADRALHWPARRRLVIADLHLGKADTFRRAGIALPSGGTVHDLDRVDTLLRATGATQLWVLGDMLHGDPAPPRWREGWDDFRARWPALETVVVAGNHDRALRRAGLGVHVEDQAVHDGPFVFRHEPDPDPRGLVLCGHVHPVVRAPGILRRRFPAFVLASTHAILPAFSAFSGGFEIGSGEGYRRWACAGDGLVDLGQ